MVSLKESVMAAMEFLGRVVGGFSWQILAGMLGVVMFFMAWIPMAATGDVPAFYREITSGTILVGTGIVEFFVYLQYRRPN